MAQPIITLMSDFGEGSPYVAQMKGAVLQVFRDARLFDITHSITPQAVRQGALVWRDAAPMFPPGTIHVGVVDPGVGTERPIVAARIAGSHYIGPDNGLFDQLIEAGRGGGMEAVRVADARFWRSAVAPTFHGRDIMAPVAGHLARVAVLRDLGPPTRLVRRLAWPEVTQQGHGLRGEVVYVDRFGNLISNIRREMLEQTFGHVGGLLVRLEGRTVGPLRGAYAEVEPGELVALIGSNDRLEVAIANGSAARALGASEGAVVQVSSSSKSQADS